MTAILNIMPFELRGYKVKKHGRHRGMRDLGPHSRNDDPRSRMRDLGSSFREYGPLNEIRTSMGQTMGG